MILLETLSDGLRSRNSYVRDSSLEGHVTHNRTYALGRTFIYCIVYIKSNK